MAADREDTLRKEQAATEIKRRGIAALEQLLEAAIITANTGGGSAAETSIPEGNQVQFFLAPDSITEHTSAIMDRTGVLTSYVLVVTYQGVTYRIQTEKLNL